MQLNEILKKRFLLQPDQLLTILLNNLHHFYHLVTWSSMEETLNTKTQRVVVMTWRNKVFFLLVQESVVEKKVLDMDLH